MNAANRCPECGAELAANAPQGLCPACLLKRGLETRTAATSEGHSSGPDDFVPPTPEELAARFPDLEILEVLGRGGMGVVYKARQKHLDRPVAMKILSPRIAQDPAFAERFTREARAMALLNHANIVTVYDFGQKDGLFYFLMELVDGLSLRQLLDAGKLSPQEALAIVPQICDALQYAHNTGVVHRDIKPENILMDRAGRVKIADFGLAKLLGQPVKDTTLTGTGQVMGTLHYMAPEQMERPEKVDHRADIYSLGVVFYQILTGELPIGRFAPPSKKVAIDVRLDDVVLRALERDPELRYQHISDVKTQMDSIAATAASPSASAGQSMPPVGFQAVVGPLSDSRLSRMALVGAAWAPLFFVVAVLSLIFVQVDVTKGSPPEPAWWQSLLKFTVLPLGLLAPFGTTILGIVSIGQIRHSAGRLFGLGLALADAMLFPLLALDALIWILCNALILAMLPPDLTVTFPSWVVVIPVALVVDFLLIRWAWRGLNSPAGNRVAEPATPRHGAVVVCAWIAFALFLLAMAAAVLAPLTAKRPKQLPSTSVAPLVPGRPKTAADRVNVEDLALEMLVAIRDKDNAALVAAAVEEPKEWRQALPHFALELRERVAQKTGKPFSMMPTESLVEGDRAVVKCTAGKDLQDFYLVLFFVKTDGGWRNWLLRNAPSKKPLQEFLKEKP